jgi:hypothetical protein
MDKHSTSLRKFVTYGRKNFYNIDHRCQCHKTFFFSLSRTSSGLYYKRVTIVIDAPSVVKVTLQIVASLTIVIDDDS